MAKLPYEPSDRDFRGLGFYILFQRNNCHMIYILKLSG